MKKLVSLFDKLEDIIRIKLSHNPIAYSLVGAVGIILLWKGVWEMAEGIPMLHGFGSVALGVLILLASGLLVSFFIGDSIIISGFKREKKLVDKSEREIIAAEKAATQEILQRIDHLEEDMHALGSGEPPQKGPPLPLA